jgi:hypothetical protein
MRSSVGICISVKGKDCEINTHLVPQSLRMFSMCSVASVVQRVPPVFDVRILQMNLKPVAQSV